MHRSNSTRPSFNFRSFLLVLAAAASSFAGEYAWYRCGGSGGANIDAMAEAGGALFAVAGRTSRAGERLYEYSAAASAWTPWGDTLNQGIQAHGDTLLVLRDSAVVAYNRLTRARLAVPGPVGDVPIGSLARDAGGFLALGYGGYDRSETVLLRLPFGSRTWLRQPLGASLLDRFGPIALEARGAELWLITSSRAYHESAFGADWDTLPAPLWDLGVWRAARFRNALYLGTRDGLYRLSPPYAAAQPVAGAGGFIGSLAAAGDSVLCFATLGSGTVRCGSDDGAGWKSSYLGMDAKGFLAAGTAGSPILYAYGSQGGVFRSADAGASWAPMNQGFADLRVYSFAQAGGRYYAGMEGGMVFQSLDSGATWSAASPYPAVPVKFDRPDSLDMPYLFAARGGLKMALVDQVLGMPSGAGHWDTLGPAPDLGLLYPQEAGSRVFGRGNSGHFASRDGGRTWSLQIPTAGGYPWGFSHEGALALASGHQGELWLSRDTGAHWDSLPAAPSAVEVLIHRGVLYAFGQEARYSNDSGKTWEKGTWKTASPAFGWGISNAAAVDGSVFGFMNYSQLVHSVDGGKTWEVDSSFHKLAGNYGLDGGRGISALQALGDRLFVGGYEGGIWVYSKTPVLSLRGPARDRAAGPGIRPLGAGRIGIRNSYLGAIEGVLIVRDLRGRLRASRRAAIPAGAEIVLSGFGTGPAIVEFRSPHGGAARIFLGI